MLWDRVSYQHVLFTTWNEQSLEVLGFMRLRGVASNSGTYNIVSITSLVATSFLYLLTSKLPLFCPFHKVNN